MNYEMICSYEHLCYQLELTGTLGNSCQGKHLYSEKSLQILYLEELKPEAGGKTADIWCTIEAVFTQTWL